MRQRGVKRERGESSRRRVARLSENTLFSSRFLPWIDPEFLALKHESRILGHSSSSRCGLSMMEQVRYRLCAVKPMENWPGSSLNHIQGWTTVRESYFCVLEQGPLDRSAPRAVYSKFTRAEPIPPFIVGEPRIMVWRSWLLLFSGAMMVQTTAEHILRSCRKTRAKGWLYSADIRLVLS